MAEVWTPEQDEEHKALGLGRAVEKMLQEHGDVYIVRTTTEDGPLTTIFPGNPLAT